MAVALGSVHCSAPAPDEPFRSSEDALAERPSARACACAGEGALLAGEADAFAFARERLRATALHLQATYPADYATRFPTQTIPSGPDEGAWDLRPRTSPLVNGRTTDWRSGFFSGALWQAYAATGDRELAGWAKEWAASVETLATTPLDHDIGFRFLQAFGSALVAGDAQADPSGAYRAHARDVLVTAATTLDTRFDFGGVPVGALRSAWPEHPFVVDIDSMMNVELLFVGWALRGRPTSGPGRTLYEHGVAHAATVLRELVRDDGSTYHYALHRDGHDGGPADGALLAKATDQGYGNETTWSRGQAWAIYGFTVTYRMTRRDPRVAPGRFLAAAERTADYFLEHLPAVWRENPYDYRPLDYVPPSDFDAALGEPEGPYNDALGRSRRPSLRTFTQRDSSAAAATASALLELGTLASTRAKRLRYRCAAVAILRSLLALRGDDGKLVYLAKDSVHRGILANAAVSWGTPAVSLIFGDAYLLEALNRHRALLAGRPLTPWR